MSKMRGKEGKLKINRYELKVIAYGEWEMVEVFMED